MGGGLCPLHRPRSQSTAESKSFSRMRPRDLNIPHETHDEHTLPLAGRGNTTRRALTVTIENAMRKAGFGDGCVGRHGSSW